MHAARLHGALHSFAIDAAAMLAASLAAGEEIPFEVVEAGAAGSRRGLFFYQPLNADFVEGHWRALLSLPSAREAQLALSGLEGLDAYIDTYAAEQRGG